MKIVLIGAGSAQFGLGALGEIFASPTMRESEVVLLDINSKALSAVDKKCQAFIEEHALPTRVSATTERSVALKDADFVIISIEVGHRFELWDLDRTIPQQYGITQVFGENGGPGGLFHSLRVIPPILEICEDAQRLCPEAVIFNYSNPMSRICTTVHRKFPHLNFVGLCHEVASLEKHLPNILGVPYEQLHVVAGGLNHFSCLLEATYRENGKDAYPEILAGAHDYFESLPGASDFLRDYREKGDLVETEGFVAFQTDREKSFRSWVERGLFKAVIDLLGLLPITTDSHFGEYPGWAHDIVDHQGIVDFYRYYQICLDQAEGKIELVTRERVVPIMEAIVNDTGMTEAAVNIPNQGLIEGLPAELVVEIPARISAKGVRGVPLKPLPPAFLGLLQNQVAVHMMTTEAVLTASKKAVVQTLLVDPVVNKVRGLEDMVDVMIDRQRPFLDYLQ